MSTQTKISCVNILTNATATGAGSSHPVWSVKKTFQGTGSVSASTGSVDVDIEVSNDNVNFIVMGSVSLSLTTTPSTDGFTTDSPWKYVRANVTAITGTDATVTITMAAEGM